MPNPNPVRTRRPMSSRKGLSWPGGWTPVSGARYAVRFSNVDKALGNAARSLAELDAEFLKLVNAPEVPVTVRMAMKFLLTEKLAPVFGWVRGAQVALVGGDELKKRESDGATPGLAAQVP